MNITLYSTTNDRRVVSKTLTQIAAITNATIYGDITVTHPTLLLHYDASYLNANYVYIPEFSRYYFINNISLSSGERMIINCEVDVLNTYKSQIKTLTCTVIRNEHAKQNYLPDKFMTPTSKKSIKTYKLENNNFNVKDIQSGANFVICVVGGNEVT